MKISYIGLQDAIGHKFNGMDLCREMRRRGHDARFYVLEKKTNEEWVVPICGAAGRFLLKAINRLEMLLSLQNCLSPIVFFLRRHAHLMESRIVHLQMVQFGFFPHRLAPFFAQRAKVLWTFHDPWPLTGHCIHPAISSCDRWERGCGLCPNLNAEFRISCDTTRFLFNRKMRAWRDLPFNIVVSSSYMEGLVRRSPIFSSTRLDKIPFGVDQSIFCPLDRSAARRRLGLPLDDFILFFRATRSEFKGYSALCRMLESLDPAGVTLVTVQERGIFDSFKGRFRIIELGWIEDDNLLATVYAAADLFLMPSRAESFGMMALEAMSCGVPVLAFDNTALSETVDYGKAGLLLPDGDAEALLEAVKRLRADSGLAWRVAQYGFLHATEHFSLEAHFDRTYSLYENCLGDSPKGALTDRCKKDMLGA